MCGIQIVPFEIDNNLNNDLLCKQIYEQIKDTKIDTHTVKVLHKFKVNNIYTVMRSIEFTT